MIFCFLIIRIDLFHTFNKNTQTSIEMLIESLSCKTSMISAIWFRSFAGPIKVYMIGTRVCQFASSIQEIWSKGEFQGEVKPSQKKKMKSRKVGLFMLLNKYTFKQTKLKVVFCLREDEIIRFISCSGSSSSVSAFCNEDFCEANNTPDETTEIDGW